MRGLGRLRRLEHSKHRLVGAHRELGRELDLLVTCFDVCAPGWQGDARLENGGGQAHSDLLVGHGFLPTTVSGSKALFGADAGPTYHHEGGVIRHLPNRGCRRDADPSLAHRPSDLPRATGLPDQCVAAPHLREIKGQGLQDRPTRARDSWQGSELTHDSMAWRREMKRPVALLVVCVAMGMAAVIVIGAETPVAAPQEITLPAPVTKGTMSVEEAIAKRRSVRGFQTKALAEQQIGQLLWAAQGITDVATGHRAAPSAMAMYPLAVYVFRADGVFAYEPKGHKLLRLSSQDRRAEVTQQPRGGEAAPVTFVFTGDRSKMGSRMAEMADRFIYLEAGHAAENLALEATALGLATVTQGGINQAAVAKVLDLSATAVVIYAMPVGYPVAR